MKGEAVLKPTLVREVLGKVDAALQQSLSRRRRHPDVDLFAELNLSGVEAFHTRMLAFLLNPLAAHGQGGLFLDLWLKCLELPGGSSGARVVAEYAITSQSRVDLLLRLKNHTILIENKVYAGEGEDQLARYATWLQQEPVAHKTLIFLTPDGRRPTSGGEPLCLSFGFLADWLGHCVQELVGRLDPGQELAAALSLYRRSCVALFNPEKSKMPVDQSLLDQLDTRPLLETALLLQEQMEMLRLQIFNQFWGRVKTAVEQGLSAGWRCHLDDERKAWPLLAIYETPTLQEKNFYCVAAGNLYGLQGGRTGHAYFGITRRSDWVEGRHLREEPLRAQLDPAFVRNGDWVGERPVSDLAGQCACRIWQVDDVLTLHADNIDSTGGLALGIAAALLVLWKTHHQDLERLNAENSTGMYGPFWGSG